MKKRIFFDKFAEMKFISHLDMLRFADRLLKKAHIPMKYSQGFHPRPKISLGNPISLGTEAYNELMDIELCEPMSNEEVLRRLGEAEVPGFHVSKIETITDKRSIVDIYTNALFEISGETKEIDKLDELFSRDEIIETKEKKGKITQRNLGERVISYTREGDTIKLELVNTSPNSFLILAEVDVKDVKIVKRGYNIKNI
ncbi:TIGR03936 family radical SAM-associated protein [uncultured Cetobacterium sp.]|uniref:TIGR03936 family radical SAM-associated protein n=1 Tax=uncultured Cetobacterium sp. TaxID=527638 RepID=UPI002626BD1D|nr:TIGR03936 family radical SAM-associated protein [uncultured Cetobacterium sp.]